MGRTVRRSSPCIPASAHPHGRGEDPTRIRASVRSAGSPPRAWGGLATSRSTATPSRLTPTGVGRTSRAGTPAWSWPAHPHGRGEDLSDSASVPVEDGSPPRAWGGLAGDQQVRDAPRLTPTGVGRTSARPQRAAGTAAHPHGRGEDTWCWLAYRPMTGSPPRAWGGREVPAGPAAAGRLTPTGVGRTNARPMPGRSAPAHPHGRGEDGSAAAARTRCAAHPHGRGEDCMPPGVGKAYIGSPPRAWGGPVELLGPGGDVRLTPTGVGRTAVSPCPDHSRAAHPHGRGEDAVKSVSSMWNSGSPPRAWGGRGLLLPLIAELRLTPTGVGRTVSAAVRRRRATAHPHGRGEDLRELGRRSGYTGSPHGRGEDSSASRVHEPLRGSPPRAWGGRIPSPGADRGHGLTPTGVGRTGGAAQPPARCPAHPHGRGEDGGAPRRWPQSDGSPPRAWGGPGAGAGAEVLGRLTPTGVGRTPRRRRSGTGAAAHPHGRGEDAHPHRRGASAQGSPPRAWGGQERRGHRGQAVRLTPTGVGRTRTAWPSRPSRSAHPHGRGEDPHGRGEDVIGLNWCPVTYGSPPRAWGGPHRQCPPGRA